MKKCRFMSWFRPPPNAIGKGINENQCAHSAQKWAHFQIAFPNAVKSSSQQKEAADGSPRRMASYSVCHHIDAQLEPCLPPTMHQGLGGGGG